MTTLERDLEKSLVSKLQDLKYEHRPDIIDRDALQRNFREKFETLNHVRLTDAEFSRLMDEIVTPDVFTAARTLRERSNFTRDDGTPLNYTLVNNKDWCKNSFELVTQLRINTDNSHHRYDAIILINGVPVVQIELKTLGVSPRRAMEQIVEYKNHPGNGYTKTILCFLQLFIVSNRDRTFYFANNNARHFAFNAEERFLPVYEFADIANKKIVHLDNFAETFLVKCTLGQTISRYMVLVASEQKLLMMRPYQVYAVKAIVDSIAQDCGNGYIWHTTGSGKTLTSFKASTLLKDNRDIEKCLFVVDRKDLDRQTREEFNKFQEGCVEENTNTASLVRRLLSDDYANKVIVCTIQKLGLALDENSKRNKQQKKDGKKSFKEQLEPLRDRRIAFIFDECHRSQFGENHKAIKEFFPRAQLFGFTGTPIFDQNAAQQKIEDTQASMKTTEDLFEKRLRTYTITHAIEDGNVLRFHVDYFKPQGKILPKPGEPLAKRAVIEAILFKHDAATGQRWFNALLATSSINDAIEYHSLFKTMQAEKLAADPSFQPLNIACVFSPPADGDPDVRQIQDDLPQEKDDNAFEPEKKKKALKAVLADYNANYGTNHKIGEFDQFYQDVQQRIKDQQWPDADLKKAYPNQPHHKIDITIVVDMLLTGFDSKFLNTLYVDKNLKHHGLIQAFSRTNRVLNATKPYGNILDFRQQQGATTGSGGSNAVAIGTTTKAFNSGSVALGLNAVAGVDASATVQRDTAAGRGATATGGNSTAIGDAATATAQNGTALGTRATASGAGAIAFGGNGTAGASAAGSDAIAIGGQSSAAASSTIAIGDRATASYANSVAVGSGSVTSASLGTLTGTAAYNPGTGVAVGTATGEMSVGTAGAERRVTNIAAGAAATDAVNVSQLQSMAGQVTAGQTALDQRVTSNANAVTALTGNVGTNSTQIAANTQSIAGLSAAITTMGSQMSVGNVSLAADVAGLGGTVQSLSATVDQTTARAAAVEAGIASLAYDLSVIDANVGIVANAAVEGMTEATAARRVADQAALDGAFFRSNSSGVAPIADGTDAIAVGSGPHAGGTLSVAIGTDSKAMGGKAVSIGAGNEATGNGAVAIGDPNIANGQGAVALGADNVATGQGAIAIGNANAATGRGAIALGNGARATQIASVAIGDQAAATREGQVAIGTAQSTVTLAGVTSAQSRAAQSGALSLITSDGLGNLATAALDLGTLQGLNGRTGALEGRTANLERQAATLSRQGRQATGGIVAAMALGGMMLPPNAHMAVSFNLATYRGQQGFSGSAIAQVTPRVYLSGGLAGSTVKGSTGGRVGMTFGW